MTNQANKPWNKQFKVGDHEYRLAGKIDVFKQFAIVKILTPIITEANRLANKEGQSGFALGGMEALAGLPDEHTKQIFDVVLTRVQRKIDDKTWVDIYSPEGGLQYDDIDLFDMLMISGEVLKTFLEPFFTKLTTVNFSSADLQPSP